jgi:hypothetical protein
MIETVKRARAVCQYEFENEGPHRLRVGRQEHAVFAELSGTVQI